MRHPSTLENKYSNIFFFKTIAPTVLKFYMEHDLAPESQNYKIGSGWISKMAAITGLEIFFQTNLSCRASAPENSLVLTKNLLVLLLRSETVKLLK